MATLRRPMLWMILGAFVLAAGTALVCQRSVNAYRQGEEQASLWEGSARVVDFAAIARSWLARGSRDLVVEAARWMLVSDTFYVQIALGGGFEIDERSQVWSQAVPMIPPQERSPGVLRQYVRDEGLAVVDVVVPYESFTNPGETAGYVRVGLNATGAERDILAHRRLVVWGAAGGNVGFWLVVAMGWLLYRRRAGGFSGAEAATSRRSVIEVGDLRIDPATREVTIRDCALALTPKQFALLHLLASEPGRVYTDREIVEAVWPASAYADIKDVKQCVYTIRQRLKPVHPAPLTLIVNVQGYGYKLDPQGASVPDPNLTG